ncbi:hypothetical protein CTA2_8466 [Colletotrichum tanaceti]|uniref:Uncharacterized protein n=1 Tax=Colletotrichum tanaceti TaxID=1306861 RepID=A0A4U6XAW3_9PEZI|nr:hypothetical protein CTA2_8466 [Colletotrichum tanaceti]TKW52383.1 hypothetical protein CTA1_71 [Colletotrichum tanaceti]
MVFSLSQMNAVAFIFTAWVPIFTFPANLQPYIVTGNYITAGFAAAAVANNLRHPSLLQPGSSREADTQGLGHHEKHHGPACEGPLLTSVAQKQTCNTGRDAVWMITTQQRVLVHWI